ncbi:MAG TPA: radical SAM protein, partial [Elusimicrobiales bacterium]|nr:radical SAM protein [Elusimicrobiales bacterium]
MSEREIPAAISTEMANQTFGRYNGLYAPTGADKARVFQVNSIIDFDPQDPETYAIGLKKIKEGISHALVRMDIDFTNACNNDCPPCFARELRERYPVEIPYEKAVRLLTDLNHLGCDCVRFTGGGDPLTHPNFVGLVRYSGANFRTVIDTNGDYLCKPEYTEAIAQSA